MFATAWYYDLCRPLSFVVTTSFILCLFLLTKPPRVLPCSFSTYSCPIYCIQFCTTIGIKLVRQHYSCIQPDEISVRQAGDLPSPSFGFLLTMNTLALYVSFPLSGGFRPFTLRSYTRRAHVKQQSGELFPDCCYR